MGIKKNHKKDDQDVPPARRVTRSVVSCVAKISDAMGEPEVMSKRKAKSKSVRFFEDVSGCNLVHVHNESGLFSGQVPLTKSQAAAAAATTTSPRLGEEDDTHRGPNLAGGLALSQASPSGECNFSFGPISPLLNSSEPATVQGPVQGVSGQPSSGTTPTGIGSVPGKSFTSCFSRSPAPSATPLLFTAPNLREGRRFVAISEDMLDDGKVLWENTLVGQFFDSHLPFSAVSSIVKHIWGRVDEPNIILLENDLYLFSFSNASACDWVYVNGPWQIGGKPFFLCKWEPGMVPATFKFSKVPIWVRFHNIPLDLWHPKGLAAIASSVGRPICLDQATESRFKLSFARINVEVDVGDDLPDKIYLDIRGTELEIPVDYPWKPKRCTKCQVFGHSTTTCTKSVNLAYVAKPTPVVGPTTSSAAVVDEVVPVFSDLVQSSRIAVLDIEEHVGSVLPAGSLPASPHDFRPPKGRLASNSRLGHSLEHDSIVQAVEGLFVSPVCLDPEDSGSVSVTSGDSGSLVLSSRQRRRMRQKLKRISKGFPDIVFT